MYLGKLAVICGLAVEAWMVLFVAAAGMQFLAVSLLG
ncbi:hypothetical protein SAMN05428969_0422 [Devosia sp. YR412]|nr:hypothetical protein SAMN05428969_0422 [Devosia sp. YR412]